MTVTRLNPPGVYNPSDAITQMVTVEGVRLVQLSGQVASDTEGRPVGLGDHAAQAAQIARNLDAALASVGATRDDIVQETVFVVDYTPELLPAIFEPLRAGTVRAPASTLVGVSALFAPGYLVEVQVVAAVSPVPAVTPSGPPSVGRAAEEDLEAALTRRAWADPAFAEQLERDPGLALAALGVTVPPGITVQVKLQKRDTLYYVVPPAKKPGEPDQREAVNLMDQWGSGDMFVWVLPERLKAGLLAMRRGFHRSRPATDVRSSDDS
ncbi:Rid family hydrolase [Streptomyces sp. DSM 41524]|uniref:Rid family hydrolase n=1 Tax=Streptomyces asiaticus subsp. ignotus TaxID=3098222 RepID=A0ABU7QB18_9ACTN|nr:Rid family hydrolase [Streptomyces sp. DSM 41524]